MKRLKLASVFTSTALLLSAAGRPAQAAAPPPNASVAPLAPVSTHDPHFGIVQAFEAPAQARAAGATWERVPFFWNQAQPADPSQWAPDQFIINASQLDAEVAAGMTV
ncbi:MAG: hypothetical protein JO247_06865, partial [Chloroflexi bacterium]|nr:hypothetical protein [Chloroflexota bacterium]